VRHTLLHLRDELLVEQAPRFLMQRAVDRHNIALLQHLFQGVTAPAANLLLYFGLEGLIVVVQQFFTIKRLKAAKHTFPNAAYCNSSNNLSFQVILIFCSGSDVPFPSLDLFVSRDKVANENQDCHYDMLCNGDNVRASDFRDRDSTVRLVGSIQVDMV
jgi:hypothetical protein